MIARAVECRSLDQLYAMVGNSVPLLTRALADTESSLCGISWDRVAIFGGGEIITGLCHCEWIIICRLKMESSLALSFMWVLPRDALCLLGTVQSLNHQDHHQQRLLDLELPSLQNQPISTLLFKIPQFAAFSYSNRK